ncbi:carboxypeptidase-like regulatory domain-containing protein [Mangrovimonas sp. YM274]|uniref:carboxypeptidase-like regulatory domain-containing protein n=1 Tax=Mangrovimonas sp. YM274 TaxID=3070660 RepID=UPI0027DB1C95|nr:carboxypeptidase-like regulatory domain-containing protein [Mangrovimonas sp. YM274]WMI69774.1 carboxypeptidase-like regulatory domain-containing protein [Mangrovimonas sp. YM274]
MNKQFNLSIKSPCQENYNEFTPTCNGRFCKSCKTEVVDFSGMDSQEITDYFKNNTTQNVCGRFKSSQLTTHHPKIPIKRISHFFNGLAFVFLSLFALNSTQGQTIQPKPTTSENPPSKIQDSSFQKTFIVKGTVSDNEAPLPGVNVILQGTSIGTSTDFNGNFEFPIKLKKGDVLVFSYVGMESQKLVITHDHSTSNVAIKVNMEMEASMLLGKVAIKKVYKSKRH